MLKSELTSLNYIANMLNTGLPGNVAKKTVTYTTLGHGAIAVEELFTVTGAVACVVFGICTTNCESDDAAKIEIGIVGNTAVLIAQTTATSIDAGQMWRSITPATSYVLNATNFPLLAISDSIDQKITTGTIKAGVIEYYCIWTPLSQDGSVVAA